MWHDDFSNTRVVSNKAVNARTAENASQSADGADIHDNPASAKTIFSNPDRF